MRVRLLFAAGFIFLSLHQRGESQSTPPATPQKAEPKRKFVVYSIADLVTNYPATMQLGNEKKGQSTSELLCDLITQTIAPATWERAGGACKLEFFSNGMAIGVNQTQEVQDEIAALLSALRRLQEVQVGVRVQLVSVPEATFDKVVTVDWIASHRAGSFANERLAFLSDAECKEFMASLHKDKRTETLVSPSLRMVNGQKATIDTTEEQFFVTGYKTQKLDGTVYPVPQNERKEVGFKAKVQATVSGDRRHVYIDLDAKRTALESQTVPLIPVQFPITQAGGEGDAKEEPKAANRISPPREAGSVEVPAPEFRVIPNGKGQPQVMQFFIQRPAFSTQTVSQKFNVPDGGTTVIVLGKERREVRQVVAPPAAAALPFGKELFGTVNISREPHMIVMFVTPRIVINEEIEREILGSNTPAPPKTPARAEQVMVTYPVADLLSESPNSDFEAALEAHASRRADGASMRNAELKNQKPAIDLLVDSILKTVRPDSWQGAGGKGVIQYFPLGNSLVITNTKQVHQEVEALLQAARRSREVQVVLDIQVVSVVDGTWERTAEFDWIATTKLGARSDQPLAFLGSKKSTEFIDSLRKDKRTEFVASPKLTTSSGQNAIIDTTEERRFCTGVAVKQTGKHAWLEPQNEKKEIGFRANVLATISADSRIVKLDLDAKQTQLDVHSIAPVPIQVPVPPLFDAPNGQGFIAGQDAVLQTFVQKPKFSTLAVQQCFNIADGATAVVVAGKESRTIVTQEPILTKIPAVARELADKGFGQVTSEEHRTVLFLVTPRIVVNEEIEREIVTQNAPKRPAKDAGNEKSREETQVYYTGGIDNPRQHTLPRDREMRVTQAIASKVTAVGPDDPIPGEVLVIRKTKSGEHTQIRVNLNRALVDPTHDVVVQNGDFLVLQESPADTLARLSRGIVRDVANIRSAPRDLSEPSEPRQPTPRR